jgi:hypothetical protein
VSDALIFVGAAESGYCRPALGYWVAIAALLVAYVGMFGQAVGVQREFSGVMSKPWRMVTLHLGAWLALGLLWFGDSALATRHASFTVLDWTCFTVIAGCVQTCTIRLARILRALPQRAPKGSRTS